MLKKSLLISLIIVLVAIVTAKVNANEIDRVRELGVLAKADLETIDGFVANAVKNLAIAKQTSNVAQKRMVVAARGCSSQDSAKDQYRNQFIESAKKYIAKALGDAEIIENEKQKNNVKINLLILVYEIEDAAFVELALKYLNDDCQVVKYWAVKNLTSDYIIEQINANNVEMMAAAKIAKALKKAAKNASVDVMALMLNYVTKINMELANGSLLADIANKRIKSYENYTVKKEMFEAELLKVLCDKMMTEDPKASIYCQQFAQLLSYVFQGYIKNVDLENDDKLYQLGSVLAETENDCVAKITNMPQLLIKKAVEKKNIATLAAEHNRLLGDNKQAGILMKKCQPNFRIKLLP